MNKLIIAGWDPGRLNNKLYLQDKKLINMNAICSGYDRRVLENEKGELHNFLDVEVYKGSKYLGRYFVGNMAYRNNRGDLRWSTSSIPKFSDSEDSYDEVVKMVTYLAFSQYESNNPSKRVAFRVGTGVPTEEYFEHPEVLDKVRELFREPYKVVFKHRLFCGAEIEVSIPKLHFKPEGTASMLSFIYNDNLQPSEQAQNIFNRGHKIIGMNIGSSTTDVAIINPDMTFDSNGFFGIDVGSSKALNEIRNILYKDYGYDTSKLKTDYLIRTYNKVRYKGQIIDLDEIKIEPLNNLVSLLKVKFYDKAEMRGIDLGEAGGIYISGGTVKLIDDKLESLINGVPSIISVNPLFDDARGYYLEAKTYELSELKNEKEIFEDDKEELHVVN